jgi:hypothetical protein
MSYPENNEKRTNEGIGRMLTAQKERKPRKLLTGNAEKDTKKYLNSLKGGAMEFQRTQQYDLMYKKRKELGYVVQHRIKACFLNIIRALKQYMRANSEHLGELQGGSNMTGTDLCVNVED